MNNNIKSCFLSLSLFIFIFSCMTNQKKNSALNNQNKIDMLKPEIEWKLIWSDEFKGGELEEKNWNRQIEKAGRFNEEWQRYTDDEKNAFVEDGKLVIQAIHETDKHGMNQYTSARLNTANKLTFKYGKITARIKLPEGQGIWPAFWMLGANINENGGDTPWPECGEIDILELYGSKNDSVVEVNAHYSNASGGHEMMGAEAYKVSKGKFSDEFHVFELEWDQEGLTWLVDGKQFASMPTKAPHLSEFHKEFFILFNIAVGGTFAGRPDETTTFPQKMYVDWVRVYQKN